MKKLTGYAVGSVLAAFAAAIVIAAPSAAAIDGETGQGSVALPPGGPISIYPGGSDLGGANPYTPFGTSPYVPWGVWSQGSAPGHS